MNGGRSTRNLLFGIFVLAGRRLTAAQVIALARPLRLTPTNVKSHLTRMVAEGALERSGPRRRAAYGPSSDQATVVESVAARLRDAPRERWDGRWLALSFVAPSPRGTRERLRTSLRFDGFRPWTPGTFVRPLWPRRWVKARAHWYLTRVSGFALEGKLLGTIEVKSLAAIYELDALDRQARRIARWLRSRRLSALSPERAFATRLEVGGVVASFIGHDPRLPAEFWGRRRGPTDLRREFHRFEKRVATPADRFLASVLARSTVRRRGHPAERPWGIPCKS